MIIKYFFLIFFFFLGEFSFSQEKHNYCLYDVDGFPLWRNLSDTDSVSQMEYITLTNQKLKVDLLQRVQFKEGKDSMENFVRKLYYNQENYDYIEINQRVIFVILFDKDLNILEIRQMPPKLWHKQEEYKLLFTKILKSTTGMWETHVADQEWYIYYFIIRWF